MQSNTQKFPFLRTICDCQACVEHCRTKPGSLAPQDIDAIAAHLGITREECIEEHLTAGRGMIVAKGQELFRIPTVVPTRGFDGACHWLKDGRCSIHEVSPYGCRFYDDHQAPHESDRRTLYLINVLYRGSEDFIELAHSLKSNVD